MIKSNQTNKSKRADHGVILRKVLAIFINTKGKKVLRPVEIAKMGKINHNSVRTAIRTLYKQKLLEKRGRGEYRLHDLERAIEYMKVLQQKKLIYLGGVPRSPEEKTNSGMKEYFRQFLDLESAFFEHGEIKFRVDHFVAEKLRGKSASIRSRDRAKQVSYATEAFSMVISKHGHIRMYLKNPKTWLREFVEFMKKRGLDEYNIKYVLQQILNAMPNAKVAVEMAVTNTKIPKGITIETKVGDKVLISRITGSHYPEELEIQGHLPLVDTFIAALASVQHFSVLEFIQANELTEINVKFNVLAKGFEKLAESLKSLASISHNPKVQQKERTPISDNKSPTKVDYIS